MQKKLLASFALILLALIGLLIRIATITATKGNKYAKQVLSQQSYDSKSIPARRGEIQDRNGIILARSERFYNVILDCYVVNSDPDYVEPTIKAVEYVLGVDAASLRETISNEKTSQSRYQIILRDISAESKKAFEDYCSGKDLEEDKESKDEAVKKAYQEQMEERSLVNGIWFEEKYNRTYPFGSTACKVVGFSNAIDVGVTGVENYYNDILNGTDGREFGYLNDDSEFQRSTIEPEHGRTLRLTVDLNIQQIVQQKIEEFDETYGDELHDGKGAKNVGVIVMDPNSGEVLAMATNHEYDLNDPNDLSTYYTGAEVKAMDDEEYVEALNTMWSNFCVSEGYEPGSVVKPITVASALQVGAVHDGDAFVCNGSLFITDTTINCDNIYGHGAETLEYGIVNSCNVVLMTVAGRMGRSNFIEFQSAFGFGSKTGIDLPNENPGVVYTKDSMHEVELATCSFGQGFTINMLQEAAAFSTVVNGGYYYQPHVVSQILKADGTNVNTVEPLILRQPISSSVSRLLRRYLQTAVKEGTGQKSQVPGYATGGKTGTAEKIDPDTKRRAKGKYLVSFIGAAPINDPKVVIYVVVDEPNVLEQADSSYAQTLFRKIATEIFPYMGLYPTEPVSDALLMQLGISREDTVENHVKSSYFQCYDKYGVLYNDAYINQNGEVVDSEGNLLEGCSLDRSEGIVTDGYGNRIEVDITLLLASSQTVAENPNIAAPPEKIEGSGEDDTTWEGADAKENEEDKNEE